MVIVAMMVVVEVAMVVVIPTTYTDVYPIDLRMKANVVPPPIETSVCQEISPETQGCL